MPSVSPEQARYMAACSHGADYPSCPPQKISAEFNKADQASGYLKQAMQRRADGGGIGGERVIPDHYFDGGMIGGSGFGRTDRLPLSVPSGSHVWPADTVSALGQGHSAAGGSVISEAMKTGPYGTAIPKMVRGPGSPRAPHVRGMIGSSGQHFAAGGHDNRSSILAASGEMVSSPEEVAALGERAIAAGLCKKGESASDCGHRLIDGAIARIRKFQIEWLRHAPPPKT